MVDVIIESAAENNHYRRITSDRHVVWTTPLTGYMFFVADVDDDLYYRKSIDGGATWSGQNIIRDGRTMRMSVHYDRWTAADTGTLINITWQNINSSDIEFATLDISDDSISAIRQVSTPTTIDTNNNRDDQTIGITKSRSGFLYIQYWSATLVEALNSGFYQSDDGGVTWNAKTDGADAVTTADEIRLLYGNEIDPDDIWMIYWDRTNEEISLKVYDFSGDSWSETLISAGMTDNTSRSGISATMRHSDNHAILVAFNEFDAATADLKAWDIGGIASITALTDVLTNSAESYFPCIMIDQQDDSIYCGYIRGSALSSAVGTHYKKSTDGGATWEAEQPMSENAEDDLSYVDCGASVGDDGGRFQMVWFNDDTNDLLTNVNNGVAIPAASNSDAAASLPEYGQVRTAIGDTPVFGATILRS